MLPQDRLYPDDDDNRTPQYLNWRENLGNDTFNEGARVSDAVQGTRIPWYSDDNPVKTFVVDLDQDGDQDVLVGSLGGLSISYYHAFLNIDGFFTQAGVTFGGELVISEIDLGDVDGDGDLDVLQTGGNIAVEWQVELWTSDSSTDMFSTLDLIGVPAEQYQNGRFVDSDHDGDLDVIATVNGNRSDSLVWFENVDGKGAFAEAQEILTQENSSKTSQVVVGDIDGDRIADVVWMTDRIVYLAGTNSGFDVPQELVDTACRQSFGSYNPLVLNLVDLDSDDDLDLVCHDRWFENSDGKGTILAIANEIPILDNRSTQADYDGDGDVDVYGDGWWLENRLVGDSNNDGQFDSGDLIDVFEQGRYETGEAASFDAGDWNQDGVFDTRDLVLAFQLGSYRP